MTTFVPPGPTEVAMHWKAVACAEAAGAAITAANSSAAAAKKVFMPTASAPAYFGEPRMLARRYEEINMMRELHIGLRGEGTGCSRPTRGTNIGDGFSSWMRLIFMLQ